MRRIIFLEGRGEIFQNHGDIFTYLPNSDVRNFTVFSSDSGFSVEYDYRYRTNNLGLVEDADVMPERDSLLVLGDSFTEGLGAEPWFRLIAPEIEKIGYQPVNGGLLGTGFQQWLKLDRHLAAKKFRIQKVMVVFISDDYRRRVVGHTPAVLQCLSDLALCHLDQSYLYRMPSMEDLSSWVSKIKATRESKQSWLQKRAGTLLPASYRIYGRLKLQLIQLISRAGDDDPQEQQSRAAIVELLRLHGPENVVFVHVPQKDEPHGPNGLGLRARRSIQDAGGTLVDGFKQCHLTATDYYQMDDHPNRLGYAKIASCVASAIRQIGAVPSNGSNVN